MKRLSLIPAIGERRKKPLKNTILRIFSIVFVLSGLYFLLHGTNTAAEASVPAIIIGGIVALYIHPETLRVLFTQTTMLEANKMIVVLLFKTCGMLTLLGGLYILGNGMFDSSPSFWVLYFLFGGYSWLCTCDTKYK